MRKETAASLKAYLIPLLVIIVIVLIIPFVLLPQIERIQEKNTEVREAQGRLDTLNSKIADLALVDETKESIMLLELEKVLPGDKKVPGVITGIRALASESNLDITDMIFEPGRVQEGTASASATSSAVSKNVQANTIIGSTQQEDSLTFVVNLTGAYGDLRRFLTSLEGAKRLMGVDQLAVEQDEEDPAAYRIELNIRAPFDQSETSGDVVADPLPQLTSDLTSLFDFLINLAGYTTRIIPTVPTGVPNPFAD